MIFNMNRNTDPRGPSGANDEFLLAATAQNLHNLAKIFPAPQHAQSMIRKALARRSAPHFLRLQHGVLPQNWLFPDLRCGDHQ